MFRQDHPGLQTFYGADVSTRCPLPLFIQPVSAGFPSPADEAYLEIPLDLNEHLIRHPAATFFVRASGLSMLGAGIHPGDLLVVDRIVEPLDGHVVIAVIDGELTVKRLAIRVGQVLLVPDNVAFSPLEVRPESELTIWGVVTHVIHSL